MNAGPADSPAVNSGRHQADSPARHPADSPTDSPVGDPGRHQAASLGANAARHPAGSPVGFGSSDVPLAARHDVALLDLDTSERMEYVLAFPKDANIDNGSISVLAPIGTAILGYAKGDVVEWPVPSGKRRIRIEDILYQPEAAGHYTR